VIDVIAALSIPITIIVVVVAVVVIAVVGTGASACRSTRRREVGGKIAGIPMTVIGVGARRSGREATLADGAGLGSAARTTSLDAIVNGSGSGIIGGLNRRWLVPALSLSLSLSLSAAAAAVGRRSLKRHSR